MDQIAALVELQAIDTRLKAIEELLGDLPRRVTQLREEEERLLTNLEVDRKRHREIELQVGKTDLNLAEIQTKIDTLKEQLYQVSTNRQYDALTHEIDYLKESRDNLETEDLTLLEEKEQLEERIRIQEETLGTLTEELKEKRGSMETRIAQSSEEKTALEEERSQKIKNINEGTMRRYDRILDARNGMAVVAIVDSACGGCGASLTPQITAEVKAGSTLHTCDTCSRILYYDQKV